MSALASSLEMGWTICSNSAWNCCSLATSGFTELGNGPSFTNSTTTGCIEQPPFASRLSHVILKLDALAGSCLLPLGLTFAKKSPSTCHLRPVDIDTEIR